jgi:hypothetical protein
MSDGIVTFHYVEKFQISGRGELYCGPCPFDDPDRTAWRGRKILVDGVVREIAGAETFMKRNGPSVGDSVGFLLKRLGEV